MELDEARQPEGYRRDKVNDGHSRVFRPIKGETPLYTSSFVSGGATPFITKSPRPKGGVISAISRLIRDIVPNQTRSKFRAPTIGMNIGWSEG